MTWQIVLLCAIVAVSGAPLSKFEHIKPLQESDVVGETKSIVLFVSSNDADENLKALNEAAAKLPSGAVGRYVLVEKSIQKALDVPELERVNTLFTDVDQLPFVDYVITTILPANLTANFTFGRRVEHLNASEIPNTFKKVDAIASEAFEQYAKIPDIQKLADADSMSEEELAPIYAQFFKITSTAIEKLAELSAQLNRINSATTTTNNNNLSNKTKKRSIAHRICGRIEKFGELCA